LTVLLSANAPVVAASTTVFFDDFTAPRLDAARWRMARTQWEEDDDNGGVVPENVAVKDGLAILAGRGDRYSGPIRGVRRRDGTVTALDNGRRCGAALVTAGKYASGRYEVRMRTPRRLGACSAVWTYHYNEKDDGGAAAHEIDIELPGRPADPHRDMGYMWALFNTWVGVRDGEYTVGYTRLPFSVNDGKFHDYRFDWHSGGPGIEPRVEWYLDGRPLRTCRSTVPSIAGHLWIGIWFPDDWAGRPDYDTEILAVDWVRITPFEEANDRIVAGAHDTGGELVVP